MKSLLLFGGFLGLVASALSADRVVLKGNIHPVVGVRVDRGGVEPWMSLDFMRLVLKPSAQQTARLAEFLEQQRDPSSPEYQHWLTPEEFGDRFGLSESEIGRIVSWLQSEGFTVERVARARNWIAFSGTAATVSLAFNSEIHRYSLDGEMHFANATEPSLPAELADLVESVQGLDDFRLKPPKLRKRPEYTTSTGTHYLAPDDISMIYDIAPLYQAGINGAGQKLVIVGQTDIKLSDIQSFRNQFGLPANVPQTVLYGKDPGVSSGDQLEANLDLEWSGAIARNATIVYVYSQNVFESLQYAIDENLGTVISMSYGGCEAGNTASSRAIVQQANAQGITWMNAAGDSGAAGCDAQGESSATQGPSVTFPSDIPEVTGVGGTEFVEGTATVWGSNSSTLGSATGYIAEKAWNDTPLGQGIEAGGGGASALFSKPWWQAGPGVPNDGSRDVPDVALAASADHDGYLMYAQGGFYIVGGTSVASPCFAGLVTLLNQYLVSKGVQAKPGLGNINPNLYSLAQSSPAVFHDITAGDNIVPCKTGSSGCKSGSFGYKAGTGYDLATGLGSVDAYNLVTKWSSAAAGVGTTLTVAASPTSILQSGSTQLTAKVAAVSGSNTPTGNVAFSLGSVTLGSAPLSGSTATLSVKGSSLTVGANSIVAAYVPTGNFAASSGTVTVTVTVPAVVTTTSASANPAIVLSTASTQVTATVKAASGTAAPTGTVTFSAGNLTLATAPLTSSGTASITVKASSLATGNNTITASFAASGNFSNSSGSTIVTVTVPPVATTMSLTANPATLLSTASTQLVALVKAASGVAAGSVTFSLANTSLGSAPLSSAGASLTVKGSLLAVGSNVLTASYTPSGNFAASSATATVTVNAPAVATSTSVSASPSTIAPTGSTVLTATVKGSTGSAATGTVTFSHNGTALGSASLTATSATLTVKGTSLSTGSNIITATYAGASSFTASSGSTTITVSSGR